MAVPAGDPRHTIVRAAVDPVVGVERVGVGDTASVTYNLRAQVDAPKSV